MGFFELPGEVRNKIYEACLDTSGAPNSVDRTKVLLLCKQTYREASDLLSALAPNPVINCSVTGVRSIFRSRTANGRPGLFVSTACRTYSKNAWTAESADRKLDERFLRFHTGISGLEFLKLRGVVELELKYSDILMDEVLGNIKDLTRALEKYSSSSSSSRNITRLNFTIGVTQGAFFWADSASGPYQVFGAKEVLRFSSLWTGVQKLLRVCFSAGIKVTADTARDFENTRPRRGDPGYIEEQYEDKLVRAIGKMVMDQGPERRAEDIIFEPVLTPECRKCLELFATRGKLEQHLNLNRAHQMAFDASKRVYNQVDPEAKRGGGCYTCAYCAKGYNTWEGLRLHIGAGAHPQRDATKGPLPRWEIHNASEQGPAPREPSQAATDRSVATSVPPRRLRIKMAHGGKQAIR